MSDLEKVLSILVAISVLTSTGSGAFMFIIGLKVRTALAENQIAMDRMLRTELDKYVQVRSHDTYVSGHAEETERIRRDHQLVHEGISGRLGELGSFKHSTENLVARHVLEIANLQRDVKDNETLLGKTNETAVDNAMRLKAMEKKFDNMEEDERARERGRKS